MDYGVVASSVAFGIAIGVLLGTAICTSVDLCERLTHVRALRKLRYSLEARLMFYVLMNGSLSSPFPNREAAIVAAEDACRHKPSRAEVLAVVEVVESMLPIKRTNAGPQEAA